VLFHRRSFNRYGLNPAAFGRAGSKVIAGAWRSGSGATVLLEPPSLPEEAEAASADRVAIIPRPEPDRRAPTLPRRCSRPLGTANWLEIPRRGPRGQSSHSFSAQPLLRGPRAAPAGRRRFLRAVRAPEVGEGNKRCRSIGKPPCEGGSQAHPTNLGFSAGATIHRPESRTLDEGLP